MIQCENGYFARYKLKDHHPYGELSVNDILVKSSNIGVCKLGIQLGEQRFYEFVRKFGFGERTGLPLPGEARARFGDKVAFQGNLDPAVLFAPPEVVARESIAVLERFGRPQRPDGTWDGHIFNLGHGISQHTPPDHVTALVEAVHAHSRLQRQPA